MVTDTRTLPQGIQLTFDVCIIGAGAAGITLARALKPRGFTVGLLESGGFDADQRTQDLYRGTTVSASLPRRYLSTSRLRYFGGATNHWNGMCRPLDRLDFEPRPWVPHSGWPIGRDALERFYHQAADILQFDRYGDSWGDLTSSDNSLIPPGGALVGRTFRMSPPTRFGRVYRDELTQSDNVEILLHATVVQIDLNDAGTMVPRVHVANLAGKRFTVGARLFILAAGGVENARLLLGSTGVQAAGVGNGAGQVGRFFMEHPELSGILVMVTDHDVFGDLFRERNTMLAPSEDTQRTREILNINVQLTPDAAPAASEAGGTMDLANVFRTVDGRTIPTAGRLPDYLSCYVRLETAPNPENRVTLDDGETDAFGMRRSRVTFTMSALETRTVAQTVDLLAREFGRRSAGRVHLRHPEDALTVPLGEPPWRGLQHGSHHIGTTRMSDAPAGGVVNRHCQVHGVDNLFVAGSSVFPTCGMANPTYTIVALALRLAEHVSARLGQPS